MKSIEKIAALTDRRVLWILMAIIALALEQTAYQIFQKWLFMRPCEQCVYIRFSMFCLIIAGVVGAIKPENVMLKSIASIIAIYGAVKGIGFSLLLNKIHLALLSGDPFGVQGCSYIPTFPFHLPLHKWFPSTFLPTGDCGIDYPIVPSDAVLGGMQKYLTDLYRDGWYLIPSRRFLNMEQAMLLCFGTFLLAIAVCLVSWIVVEVRKRRRST
jgi:disulfide bond formation protein DsbB